MEWLFGEKIDNLKLIDEIEHVIEYQYPSAYKKLVQKNDGAYLTRMLFDTAETKERVFGYLLSFRGKALDGALDIVLSSGKKRWDISGLKWRYVPFASDPFGNMICFDRETDHVVFFDHETRRIEEVADSFTEFIDSLYESKYDDEDDF